MKPEEFEVYVIPPNFMEGGTLFGGLLKTRNTIEAVILGLAVGVPVLHLPFSLTVRVVILCLTALPLVLLALIGVSGMSLSAFIRLFFCFLHNRRILSRDGTQGGKNGKTLLPSWAQQRKSNCEAEDPPLPKSRSRFSVDLKQRSVTQFKTFLQEEEAVQPLNALADYIPIEKIEHGVIYTRNHRYVKVVEVVPVNFLLRSAREQRSIIYSFISYLKIAPVKVQFKALTKRADINRHLDTVRKELEHEQDPRCRVLQEDYLKLIRQLGSREAITRRFFLIFEYEPLPGTKRGHEEEDAIASLQTAARTAANYLRQCGNEVISPENEDDATAEILYIETEEERREVIWHEIKTSHIAGRILTGTLDGVEQTPSGRTIVVVDYKGYRVAIPLKEMMLYSGPVPYGAKYKPFMERMNSILATMLTAEIDFIVRGLDNTARSVVASRKAAMLRKRQTFYLDANEDGVPMIYEGRVVQARVIGVAEKVLRVEVFGVECTIFARDLSAAWFGDAREYYSVGDRVLVRVLTIDRSDINHISITADIRSVSSAANQSNLDKCVLQGKYAGRVTDVRHGVVFIRLNNGVNAVAHTCYDRRMPGKKDDVSFAVTRLDEERGIAVGIITRIIKQNL